MRGTDSISIAQKLRVGVGESRVRSSIAFSDGILVHAVVRVDSFRTLIVFRVRKMVAVIRVYRQKLRRVSLGL